MRQYSTNEKTPAGQRRITVVGVDLGKTWIEVCGQDASGKVRLTGVPFFFYDSLLAIFFSVALKRFSSSSQPSSRAFSANSSYHIRVG